MLKFFNLIITKGQAEDAIRHGKFLEDFAKATEPNAKKPTISKKKDRDI